MLINDIRIYGLDQLINRVMLAIPSLNTLKSRTFHDIATRFALALRSKKFDCRPGDVCHLTLAFNSPHGIVKPEWSGRCRNYTCGVDPIQFANSDENIKNLFFIDAIYQMLTSISAYEKLADSIIMETRNQLVTHGETLEIVKAQRENKNYRVAVLYTVGQPSKFIVSGIRKDTLIERKVTVVELVHIDDIFLLAGQLTLKSSLVAVYPKKTDFANLTMRNYLPRLKNNGFCLDKEDVIQISLQRLIDHSESEPQCASVHIIFD